MDEGDGAFPSQSSFLEIYKLDPSNDETPMRFGVRMDSMLNNTVEIVDPSKTRAWQTLKDKLKNGVVYL